MAKLSGLSQPIALLGQQTGYLTRHDAEAARLASRDRSVEWRKWYKTKRWYELRQRVFVRDGYLCQQTGVLLVGRHPAENSPIADHKKPHRGDPVLFWDEDNIQTVSKKWHDSVKQAEEARQPRI